MFFNPGSLFEYMYNGLIKSHQSYRKRISFVDVFLVYDFTILGNIVSYHSVFIIFLHQFLYQFLKRMLVQYISLEKPFFIISVSCFIMNPNF